MKNRRATVAWHGISVTTPDDWGLAGTSGDEEKGYLRVDSPMTTMVEIRWSAAKTAPDLVSRANDFIGSMRRESKKTRTAFTGKVEARKDAPPGTPVKFIWRAHRNAYGRLTYCKDCGRVIIAQVTAPRDENCASLANEILDSITDHNEDGWNSWALFGLQTAVPPGFVLDKYVLLSAHVQLSFKSRLGELIINQWGLASSLIKKRSVDEWYNADVLSQIKLFKAELEPVEDGPHTAFRISGRRVGWREKVKTAVKSLTLRPLPQRMSGYVWLCPESNRLFSIRLVHNDPALADRIREHSVCH